MLCRLSMGQCTPKNNLLMGRVPVVASQDLAVKIGLEEAICLDKLHYLLTPKDNFTNYRLHQYEGKHWIYHTIDELIEKIFPFWSVSKVERVLKKLRELNLVSTAHLHFKVLGLRGVRTLWYSINYAAVDRLKNNQESTAEVVETTQNQPVAPEASGNPQNEGFETSKMQVCTTPQNDGMVEAVSTEPQPIYDKGCNGVGTDPAVSLKNNIKNISTTNVCQQPLETETETIDDFVITEMKKKLGDEEYEELEPHIRGKLHDYQSHQTKKGDLIHFAGALMFVKNGIEFIRNSLRRTAKVTAALDKKNTANAQYQETLAKKIQHKSDEIDRSLRSTKDTLTDRSWADGMVFEDGTVCNTTSVYTSPRDVYVQAADEFDDISLEDCYV